MAPRIYVPQASVRKLSQLTGDTDFHWNVPVANSTGSRFGLAGTDLGSSFEHQGRLWFLFGDTHPVPPGEWSRLGAVSRATEHMEVFCIGEDGYMRGRYYWGSDWEDGFVLGGGYEPRGAIAAVSRNPGLMDLFTVRPDGLMEWRSYDNGWNDPRTLGEAAFAPTSGVAAVSRGPGMMEVFAVGLDGIIRGRPFENGWGDWYELPGCRFRQTAGLAAVSRGPSHMEVYGIALDGVIRGRWFWDNWKGDWLSLQGVTVHENAPLSAVSRTDKHMEVYTIDYNGAVRGRFFWDNTWDDRWFTLGGEKRFPVSSGLAAVSRNSEHMEVFAVASDGVIHSMTFNSAWEPPPPRDLPWCTDSVASSTSVDPANLRLEFLTGDTGRYRPPQLRNQEGAKLRTRCFEVPVAGFSADGGMYIFHTTDAIFLREKLPDVTCEVEVLMGKTYLTEALNGDPTNLETCYLMSDYRKDGRFINVACQVAANGLPGLPFPGPALLAWGSGSYRSSAVYFACAPLSVVTRQKESWWYFAGPAEPWQREESRATPVVDHRVVGELSVTWAAPLGLWIMLYNCCQDPRGVIARAATSPWGPWSEPAMALDPEWDKVGYGHIFHRPGIDSNFDRGREDEVGGEYGPYVIDRFTRDATLPRGLPACQIYFVLSTWNPYTTVLMTATVERLS